MNDPSPAFAATLDRARALVARHELLQAELLFLQLLQQAPTHRELLADLAGLALHRDDDARALQFLQRALAAHPAEPRLALETAQILWRHADLDNAQAVLEGCLRLAPRLAPGAPMAWLALGELRRTRGQHERAARAWHQAVERAAAMGEWQHGSSAPEGLRALLQRARDAARHARRQHLHAAYAPLAQVAGAQALRRVDRALDNLIGGVSGDAFGDGSGDRAGAADRIDTLPADARQRPKFLYFPDLPSEPYLDPSRVPWAGAVAAAYPAIRQEALGLLDSREALPPFLDFDPGDRLADYLGGSAARPAWDAFFFYRRGERYDANHRRCPQTSALLDAIDLFRIPGQAPEICFSFLAPQTTIQPHHGVSNTRLVMHLPLRVPPDCALHLVGAGEHHWQEGRLVLFDDTFLHGAWNRSDEVRIVLLMDCWHPDLTPVERQAVAALIQASSVFDQAL